MQLAAFIAFIFPPAFLFFPRVRRDPILPVLLIVVLALAMSFPPARAWPLALALLSYNWLNSYLNLDENDRRQLLLAPLAAGYALFFRGLFWGTWSLAILALPLLGIGAYLVSLLKVKVVLDNPQRVL